MRQLSLYMDDAMLAKLQLAAKAHNSSIAKYVVSVVGTQLLREDVEENSKKRILRSLKGAISDDSFTVPEEIHWDADPDDGAYVQ